VTESVDLGTHRLNAAGRTLAQVAFHDRGWADVARRRRAAEPLRRAPHAPEGPL